MGSKTNNWFNELSGRPLKGRRMPGQLGGVDTPAWGRKVLRMNTKFQGPESLEKFKKRTAFGHFPRELYPEILFLLFLSPGLLNDALFTL